MIHFKTFDDLTREVEQDDLGKWDRKVLAEAIELRYGKLRLSPHRGGTVSGLILSDRAIQNICELVGIPVDYFYRCPPPLQDVQFNFWLRECCRRDEAERKARLSSAPIQLLLRAKRDILRAVLAHDYPCFDHRDLLNFLKPKLRRRLAVSAYELEGDQLWITLVMPESARTVTKSHSYLLGCQLYNSEIAEAVITVRPVIVVESSETEIGCPTAPVELVHAAGAYDARHGFQTDVERAMETAFTRAAEFLGLLERYPPLKQVCVDKALSKLTLRCQIPATAVQSVGELLASTTDKRKVTAMTLAEALVGAAKSFPPALQIEQEALAGHLLFGEILRHI
ncbi:MAG: hypothetical protein U0R49_11700 [Fimbriimonadales bacterium]